MLMCCDVIDTTKVLEQMDEVKLAFSFQWGEEIKGSSGYMEAWITRFNLVVSL